MNPTRSRLSILLYLTTIMLWSFSVDENRALKQLFAEKSEAMKRYDSLVEEHDYLTRKHEIVVDYANGWYEIDWDKAMELNERK